MEPVLHIDTNQFGGRVSWSLFFHHTLLPTAPTQDTKQLDVSFIDSFIQRAFLSIPNNKGRKVSVVDSYVNWLVRTLIKS
jgi:hypothetical protein